MNGYISVDFGGVKRGIKFNMYAFEFLSRRGIKLKEGETFTSELTSEIVYAGLHGNCWAKETAPDFSWEEVTEWVEDLWYNTEGQKLLVGIFDAFQNSKPVQRGKQIADQLDEESKKKLMEIMSTSIGTPSNVSPSENLDSSPASIIT